MLQSIPGRFQSYNAVVRRGGVQCVDSYFCCWLSLAAPTQTQSVSAAQFDQFLAGPRWATTPLTQLNDIAFTRYRITRSGATVLAASP
jgi:hypothetical protein